MWSIPTELILFALGTVSAGLGWFVKGLSTSVKDLQKDDKALTLEVHKLALIVSGLQQFQADSAVFRKEVIAKLDYIVVRLDEERRA